MSAEDRLEEIRLDWQDHQDADEPIQILDDVMWLIAEVDRLRSSRPTAPESSDRLEKISRELIAWVSTPGSAPPLTFEDIEWLVTEVRRLRAGPPPAGLLEALEKYGDHLPDCALESARREKIGWPAKCQCGFDDVRAALHGVSHQPEEEVKP